MFYGILLCRRIGPDKEHQMAAFVKGIVCDYGDGFRKLQCQEIAAIDKASEPISTRPSGMVT